jgi:hypothetical protein
MDSSRNSHYWSMRQERVHQCWAHRGWRDRCSMCAWKLAQNWGRTENLFELSWLGNQTEDWCLQNTLFLKMNVWFCSRELTWIGHMWACCFRNINFPIFSFPRNSHQVLPWCPASSYLMVHRSPSRNLLKQAHLKMYTMGIQLEIWKGVEVTFPLRLVALASKNGCKTQQVWMIACMNWLRKPQSWAVESLGPATSPPSMVCCPTLCVSFTGVPEILMFSWAQHLPNIVCIKKIWSKFQQREFKSHATLN